MPGAAFEITIDRETRSSRDSRAIAVDTAEYLKLRNLNAEVRVRDVDASGARGPWA